MRGALRLVRFRGAAGGGPRLGLEEAPGGDLVDLSAAEPQLPRSMREFLEIGPRGLELAHRALQSGRHRVPRAAAQLLAPLDDPQKLICVGLNYHDHCQEQAVKVPKEPLIFSKFPSAITGPFDDIVHPHDTSELDWEVELAAVIGKTGRHIEEAAALQHVLGFTVANDVSARDWQMRRNGRHVNGQRMQDSNTRHLIFGVPALVAWVSRFVTLVPGDILLTGTPAGVGVFRKPPVFLKRGDEVQCEIQELGTICNRVV
ncbi:Fumarylacetoacetate hydrolase domain-containing protein 2 [Lonchura striata]|uniref:Fumarylacetoacetate hydrolase domain-containing protein 2 n=1 Tax=Lonchura striata TaxID=40157 RepID=A0A218UC71_9PASE|nr:Fumarylacetoacetate hydrolase domain-containing protein 2 [Lonchura striata domestica]